MSFLWYSPNRKHLFSFLEKNKYIYIRQIKNLDTTISESDVRLSVFQFYQFKENRETGKTWSSPPRHGLSNVSGE